MYDPSVDLAGKLVEWYRADSLVYSDMNGTTTPAVNEGNAIKTWVSKIGSARFYSVGDPGQSRFTLALNAANGQPALFKSNQDGGCLSNSSPFVKTVVAVAKYNGTIIDWNYPQLIGRNGANLPTLLGDVTGSTNWISFVYFASPWVYRLNGVVQASRPMPMNTVGICEYSDSSGVGYTDDHILGQAWQAGGRTWKGWIFELLILSDNLTTTERDDLNAYLSARYMGNTRRRRYAGGYGL